MAVRAHADNDEQRYGSGFAVEPNTHHRAWPLTRTAFSPRWRRYGRLTTVAREYAAVIFGFDEIVEHGAPGFAALTAHPLDCQQHLMAVRAHADNDEQRYGSGFAVEPNTHHRAWP